MPEDHQKYLEWNGARFRKWAKQIGPNVYEVVNALLTSGRVEQQSYRSCMGLLKLAEKHSPAYKVEKALCEIPLPEETELIESLSQAGKLTGNGNGMQYFGAILIKSELSLEELDAYYSDYRRNEWEYLVEIQEGQSIDVIEHGELQFSEEIKGSGYYIVYSWGSGDSLLQELDIRGH